MKLLKPSVKIETRLTSNILRLIEDAGRTCYKSEAKHDEQVEAFVHKNAEASSIFGIKSSDKTNRFGADKAVTADFIRRIIKRGHHSVLEHASMTVRFICDRGVSHELVRHRLAAFSQESTRYVNYGGGCQFIIPPWVDLKKGIYGPKRINNIKNGKPDGSGPNPSLMWLHACHYAETYYMELLLAGWSPQQARSVLPNSTKTEVVMTANMREWRHVLTLRTSSAAHPQMREIMLMLLDQLKASPVAVLFEDIEPESEA